MAGEDVHEVNSGGNPRDTDSPASVEVRVSAWPAATHIGQRSTRQRCVIVSIMSEAPNFRSVADTHKPLMEWGGKVGLMTVYRTPQSLAEMDIVNILHNTSGETLYRLCGDHYHYHLVCIDCGNTAEVAGGLTRQWARSLVEEHGLNLAERIVGVLGPCRGYWKK